MALGELFVCAALNFIRHPERSEAESNFFVLDPKRHCVPFAPHCVRSSTALRMTQTKKCRAKQGRIYKEVTHIVRCTLTLTNFLVSLFLLTQEAQKKKLRKKKSAVFLCRFLKKAPQKLFLIALCKMYIAPDGFGRAIYVRCTKLYPSS